MSRKLLFKLRGFHHGKDSGSVLLDCDTVQSSRRLQQCFEEPAKTILKKEVTDTSVNLRKKYT